MAGITYREPISILSDTTTTDGQFGQVGSGDALLYDNILATISEYPSNPNYTDVTKYSNSQKISFMIDPTKPITEKHRVEWRGKALEIKSMQFNDTRTVVTLRTASK